MVINSLPIERQRKLEGERQGAKFDVYRNVSKNSSHWSGLYQMNDFLDCVQMCPKVGECCSGSQLRTAGREPSLHNCVPHQHRQERSRSYAVPFSPQWNDIGSDNKFTDGEPLTLFWKCVPLWLVKVRLSGQQPEYGVQGRFWVRVMVEYGAAGPRSDAHSLGYPPNNNLPLNATGDLSCQSVKRMRFYVYDDNDESFLYSLDLDDSGYGQLRLEEKLLVDFHGFLKTMLWLLELSSDQSDDCKQEHEHFLRHGRIPIQSGKQPPVRNRFRMVLHVQGGQNGRLEFLECHTFRELPHLTLKLKSSSEETIRQFLAFRLSETCREVEAVQALLKVTQEDKERALQEIDAIKLKNIEETCQYSTIESTYRMEKDSLVMKLQSSQEKNEVLQAKFADSLKDLEALQRRLPDMEKTIQVLNLKKQTLEESVKKIEGEKTQLHEKYCSVCAELKHCRELCDSYKLTCTQTESRVQELKQVVSSHEETMSKYTATVREHENKVQQLEHSLDDAQSSLRQEKSRADSLERDLMHSKSLHEESKYEKQSSLEQVAILKAEIGEYKHQINQMKEQTVSTAQKLQNSERMIIWLNRQLTSIQMQSKSVSDASAHVHVSQSSGPVCTSNSRPVPSGIHRMRTMAPQSAAVVQSKPAEEQDGMIQIGEEGSAKPQSTNVQTPSPAAPKKVSFEESNMHRKDKGTLLLSTSRERIQSALPGVHEEHSGSLRSKLGTDKVASAKEIPSRLSKTLTPAR